MKKTFLYLLLLPFMACKTEVNVEEDIAHKSLEEVWCMDIPRVMKESFVGFRFKHENNIFFLNQGKDKAEFHQIDLITRELKGLKLDLKSVNINSLYSFNIKTITNHKNDIYFITETDRLLRYDIQKQEFERITEDVIGIGFSEDSEYLYIVKESEFSSGYELGVLNPNDKNYELIIQFKTKIPYSASLCLFKDEQMDQFAFIKTSEQNFLIDLKNKKIIRESYLKDSNNKGFLYQAPFAYSIDGKLYKIDIRNGDIQWESSEILNIYYDKMVIDESQKRVFISNNFNKLSCIDAQNGQTLWTKQLNVNPDNKYAPSLKNELALLNGLLYVSNGENLLVFDEKTGEELLRQNESYSIGSPMFIDNDNKLIYTFKDGKLCALKGLK